MNDWMNPNADASASATPRNANSAHTDQALRLMDLALATGASALLLALSPVLLWAWLSAEAHTSPRLGAHRRAFNLRSWRFADNTNGRLLSRLGARSWPVLLNILRGEMAWVGPRARRIEEPMGPATPLRPGLTGVHQLRRATSMDFVSEDSSETRYLAERGLLHDLRLLALSSWNGVGRRAPQAPAPDTVQILDTSVNNLAMDEALQRVVSLIESGTHGKVGFVNPACANIAAGNRAYRRDLAAFDLVLPDGIGMKIAADWLGTPIRQNVNGTDFFPRLCNAMAERGQRLYLVGARPEVVARVAEVVAERWPGIEIVGAQHGYFDAAQERSIAHDIQESGAHVALVAMGVPAQEDFIARLGDHMGPCVAIGVGGLFDFVAGRVSRAPQWMRDAGLEWVWRLIQEPGRLWQRYLVGNASFLARVALQHAGLRSAQKPSARSAPLANASTGRSAVLLATHALDTGGGTFLAASLPFGPASFAEIAVAQLASAGVARIHVLLAANGPSASELQTQLGNGRRWGVEIHWLQSAVEGEPYQPLRALAQAKSEPLLLINAHTWLCADAAERIARAPQIALHANASGEPAWQGWACASTADLQAISRCEDAAGLEAALLDRLSTRYLAMPGECASASTRAEWLRAPTAVPAKRLAALQTGVWTAHPWGYASAHAHVSSDAHIEGPVWIGPGCVVGAEAHLGPHVTLTANVIVEKHATLAHAVALPDAFVGATPAQMEGVCMATPEPGLSPLEGPVPEGINAAATDNAPHRASRGAALVMATLLAPAVLPWLALRKLLGHPAAWGAQRVVSGRAHPGARLLTIKLRQPLSDRPQGGRLLASYGALLDVVQGRRHWAGVRPRRIEQWFALETDDRLALNFAPIGLWHPVAWTSRLDCALHSEALADRLWRARQSQPSAGRFLRQRWTTRPMSYRALTVN